MASACGVRVGGKQLVFGSHVARGVRVASGFTVLVPG